MFQAILFVCALQINQCRSLASRATFETMEACKAEITLDEAAFKKAPEAHLTMSGAYKIGFGCMRVDENRQPAVATPDDVFEGTLFEVTVKPGLPG